MLKNMLRRSAFFLIEIWKYLKMEPESYSNGFIYNSDNWIVMKNVYLLIQCDIFRLLNQCLFFNIFTFIISPFLEAKYGKEVPVLICFLIILPFTEFILKKSLKINVSFNILLIKKINFVIHFMVLLQCYMFWLQLCKDEFSL